MAAKMLSVVVLAIAVLTASSVYGISLSEIGPCPQETGNMHFKLSNLCGKKFYATYTSGNSESVTCIIGRLTCNNDGTVIYDKLVFVNGENPVSESASLTDLGHGVIERTIQTSAGSVKLLIIVTSHDAFANGDVKMSYVVCSKTSNNFDHNKAVIITTFKDADPHEDIIAFNRLFPTTTLYSIPTGEKCDVRDRFTN